MTPTFSAAAFPQGLIRLCAVLCAVVLAMSLFPQLANAADGEAFTFKMAPQRSGDTAIKAQTAEDKVVLSGKVPAGNIEYAEWLALDADGQEIRERVYVGPGSGALNKPGVAGATNDFVYNLDGSLTGQLTVPSVYGDPNTEEPGVEPCTADCVVGARLELTIAGNTGTTNIVPVDYTRPRIERYDTVAPDQIRVVFSEPVRMRETSLESPAHWTVGGDSARAVLAVEGATEGDCRHSQASWSASATGCTRTLRVAPAVGEDETPVVEFTYFTLPDQVPYIDRADSRLTGVIGFPAKPTVDRIRPAAPDIQLVQDAAPSSNGEVIGNSGNPRVIVGNLTGGHDVTLTVTRNGSPVDTQTKTVPAGATQDEFTPALPADGDYTLTVVATDGAGNSSDNPNLRASRADGRSSVTYILDRVAPEVLAVTPVDNTTVDVVFSEAVRPANNAGQWKIGDVPAEATGSGVTRQLTTGNTPFDRNAEVSWSATPDSKYTDRAGNVLAHVSGLTISLDAVSAPTVTTPTRGLWTNDEDAAVTIAGTASGSNLVAELFERNADQPIGTEEVRNGSWTFSHTVAKNQRNQFQVRLRDANTNVHGPRVDVPDIVHDDTKPVVDVSLPADAGVLGSPQEYGVGDSVTIKWVATDRANDTKQPDHSKTVSVFLDADSGARAIATDILPQPGQEQTFSYTLQRSDLDGRGLRDLAFRVDVADFAGNTGNDISGTIRLLGDRIGYTPVLVAPGVIEARFDEPLQGTMMPDDWRVSGQPVVAEQPVDRDGTTIVVLRAPLDNDPNATPSVQFSPSLAEDQRLRSRNDSQISTSEREALDRIVPELDVQRPDTPSVIDADSVHFSGTTDATSRPNTIAAYPSDAAGNRQGSALNTTTARQDGTWSFDVALEANQLNRIIFRAIDPSGNHSGYEPSAPYEVTEDSIAPVTHIVAPDRAGLVGKIVRIRWSTVEANKSNARIEFRPRNGGSWNTVTAATADDGFYKWGLPEGLNDRIFELRVRSFDKTGKAGTASVDGLRADLEEPVLRRARALGPRKVRLFFNEPMNMTREGFTVDGMRPRRVVKRGSKQTLLLPRSLSRTAPKVVYRGTRARDLVGNRLAERKLTAERAFVFAVTNVEADRMSGRTVRVTWRDARNNATHVKHYRIYRNGKRIRTVTWSVRMFRDINARRSYRYVVRAVDNEGRISSGSGDRVR